jgi:HEAT repeat protein
VLIAIVRELDEEPPPESWSRQAVRLVARIIAEPDDESVGVCVELARWLASHHSPLPAEWAPALAKIASAGLEAKEGSVRANAAALAAFPELDLVDRVAGLIRGSPDACPEVRCLAIVAVAPHEEVISTEELLPFLHDADAEVRAACEQALRGRGLSPSHLQLAKLLTDPQPSIRARVPSQVHECPDLDWQVWLDRLIRDPSPAVRAAAIRAADSRSFGDGLRQIANEDPSPTIRQIAEYYLRNRN